MIIGKLKQARNSKGFITTPKFSIIAIELKGKIIEFEIKHGDKSKIFKVKDNKILPAWLLVEKYCEKL
jgi:hypothetical protein